MRRILIQLAGGGPLYQPATCRAVLERLLQRDQLPPDTWGLDETEAHRHRRHRPDRGRYAIDAHIASQAQEGAGGRDVRRGWRTAECRGPRDLAGRRSLADALAEAFQPDIGWVHACFDTDPPLLDARSQAWWVMDQIVDGGGGLRGYGRAGPGGLAMISYLGPRWAARLGEHLREVPGLQCEALAWGGMRVALCDAVFDAPDARLADQWSLAMARVRDEQVFATCTVRPDGATTFARGARFDWPDGYRP